MRTEGTQTNLSTFQPPMPGVPVVTPRVAVRAWSGRDGPSGQALTPLLAERSNRVR
jgi:hypothetical protein